MSLDLLAGPVAATDRGGDLTETASAIFSPDRAYRYALTRTWGERAPAVFVLLNPSTADAFRSDPTVTRCARFARREQCGGLVVVNLFALRSTDPRVLRRHPDPAGPDNDRHILEYCRPGRLVIAGWGAHGRLRDRDRAVLALLSAARVDLRCLGTTAGGSPRHPLYLSRDTRLTTLSIPLGGTPHA
jgi:hypothetical protein